MILRLRTLFLLCCVLLALATNAYSGVIWGIKEYDNTGWDFSDTTSVGFYDPNADIVLAYTIAKITVNSLAALLISARYPARIALLPDSTLEDLKYAPPDSSSLYVHETCVLLNKTYVVKTKEEHYAKFRFLYTSSDPLLIEYVYQPDGSRKLFDSIGVEYTSWGFVKKRFH